MRKRERVHPDEPIELLERRVAPGEAGMEAERLAGLFQRCVKAHATELCQTGLCRVEVTEKPTTPGASANRSTVSTEASGSLNGR